MGQWAEGNVLVGKWGKIICFLVCMIALAINTLNSKNTFCILTNPDTILTNSRKKSALSEVLTYCCT
jgi:hypothetical protein